jgi:hypothetical protein
MAAALPQAPNELIVHEWGTFTSVAGADGSSVQWQPLSAPQDLPCFVNRLGRSEVKVVALDAYSAGQPALAAIRMRRPSSTSTHPASRTWTSPCNSATAS